MITGCCRDLLLIILFQIKIIISTEIAAVVLIRTTKTDEPTVANMIVLSCNDSVEVLMLEASRVVIANDEVDVDPELLVRGFTVTVEFISWPAKGENDTCFIHKIVIKFLVYRPSDYKLRLISLSIITTYQSLLFLQSLVGSHIDRQEYQESQK